MGKKASLKHDVSFESYANEFQDYDDEWDDDDEGERYVCSHVAAPKFIASRNAKKIPSTTNRKREAAAGTLNAIGSSSSKGSFSVLPPMTMLRYYKRDPRLRITTIIDANSLVHVATYLNLRSVSALCCTCRLIDDLLSADYLYCRESSMGTSGINSNLMLPCVTKLSNILPLSTSNGKPRSKGIARLFTHESELIFGATLQNVPPDTDTAAILAARNRNYAVAGHIRYKNEVNNVHLFGSGSVAVVTSACEIFVFSIETSAKAKERSTPAKSSFTPPSCDILLDSVVHSERNILALLSTVPKGSRYLLSLLKLPRHRGDGPDLISQCKLPPINLFLSSKSKPIVQFNADGSRILFGTTEKCFVAHTSLETSIMYSPHQRQFSSLTLHDRFLFCVRNRTISIYDVTKDDEPIACGQISSEYDKPESIFLFGGRLWMMCSRQLLCTPRILQNLKKVSACGGVREGARTSSFNVVIAHAFSFDSSDNRCVWKEENNLYVSSGQKVRVFDRRDVSSPFLVTANAEITSIFADTTKLICSTKHPNRRSGRIEIFPIDTATRTVFRSVFVRKTFLSSHVMSNVKTDGRLLSVSYSYDEEAASPKSYGGDVQIFDLLQVLDGR
eukprot:CAMPEP_0178564882 /NCGR_PEP_ID=MMETSP0697-20121206/13864_1 /TAXON_ID=265572 /ORGANISM="Extubocellulus spinifer, Strain CCMP396" /LENGTH=616 /DNA_ID=CAMNT_0020198449 /DNA_START=177 /DNA_END=2027 /DNA_ORIENTATION=+